MADALGVAVVGYGYWGANLTRNVRAASGTQLVRIIESDSAHLGRAAREHPGVATSAELDDALGDDNVEAVILATPAASHCALAHRVLDAGRHVLVEKPLALTPEDADGLAARGNDAHRIVMVGHTFLYSPPVLWLRECVSTGRLGKVQYLYSQRLNLGRIRSDCNALWNFGPHDVSIMLFLLGEAPAEVSARGFAFLQDEIDDVCFASLAFPSGAAGNLHVSWIDPRKTRLMTVVGDEKMVVYDDVATDEKLRLYDAGAIRGTGASLGEYRGMAEFQWRTRAGDVLIPKVAMREPLLAEIEAFAEACSTGIPPVTDARHGATVVKVLWAIDQSVRHRGASVEVPR